MRRFYFLLPECQVFYAALTQEFNVGRATLSRKRVSAFEKGVTGNKIAVYSDILLAARVPRKTGREKDGL
jgi:hypothetical protein